MKRSVLAAAALMLCGAGCSGTVKIAAATPDPDKRAGCPDLIEAPAALPQLLPFALPDGQVVVPLTAVLERDSRAAEAILLYRGAWLGCRSVVRYDSDFFAGLPRNR